MNKYLLLLLLPFVTFVSYGVNGSDQDLKLWYDRPADYWVEALPLGNGHLGAMMYGIASRDTVQINEDTFWSGSPYNNYNPKAKGKLKEIQSLIDRGEYAEAQKLSMANITADRSVTAHGMIYESIGNLILDFPGVERIPDNYRRELDLGSAVAKVTYTVGGVDYTREMFTSLTDDLIIIRITASKPGKVTFATSFTGPLKKNRTVAVTEVVDGTDNMLRVSCAHAREAEENIPNRLHATAIIKVMADGGTVTPDDESGRISVNGADSATIYVSAATNFKNYRDISGDSEEKAMSAIKRFDKDYATAKSDHVAKYRGQFGRVSLDLGSNHEQEAKPTDVRIREFSTVHDPSLAAMYFQFGRYLLISSSQPGTQPANLQGIWNPSAGQYPAWDKNMGPKSHRTHISLNIPYILIY